MPAASIAVLVFAVSVPQQAASQEAWTQADVATVRLDPERFVDLPGRLRRELKRRGCTIPQTFIAGASHNVISGRFRNAKDVDWAVLCSRSRTSSIVVFWGGAPHAAEELCGKCRGCSSVKVVREATERFHDVSVAEAEGYVLQFGCVSGSDAGAMGLHFVNASLVGDGGQKP